MHTGKRQGQLFLSGRASEARLPLGVSGVTFLSNALGERLWQRQEGGQNHPVASRFSGATVTGFAAPALCTQLAHTFALQF